MIRLLARSLAPLALLVGLALCVPRAHAQSPNPNDNLAPEESTGESSWKPDALYGYVGTGFLATGVMFLVCKSARR